MYDFLLNSEELVCNLWCYQTNARLSNDCMPMVLQRVDKLVVTFLVDNTIEWFTKLPPGFSHV